MFVSSRRISSMKTKIVSVWVTCISPVLASAVLDTLWVQNKYLLNDLLTYLEEPAVSFPDSKEACSLKSKGAAKVIFLECRSVLFCFAFGEIQVLQDDIQTFCLIDTADILAYALLPVCSSNVKLLVSSIHKSCFYLHAFAHAIPLPQMLPSYLINTY